MSILARSGDFAVSRAVYRWFVWVLRLLAGQASVSSELATVCRTRSSILLLLFSAVVLRCCYCSFPSPSLTITSCCWFVVGVVSFSKCLVDYS